MVLISRGEAVDLEPLQGTLPVFLGRGRFGDLPGGASGSDPVSGATNLLESGVAGVEFFRETGT